MPFTVILTRHGQSTMNLDKKVQTFTDAVLSELGEQQALLLGEHLKEEKFDLVFSSDLTRAIQTAEHILKKNIQIPTPMLRLDERLRERNFGEWEGKPVEDLHKAAEEANTRMHKLDDGVAETYSNFKIKVGNFFQELCEEMGSHEKELNILIVSHGGWILTFFDLLTESEAFDVENLVVNEKVRSPKNTSFSRMRIERITNEASNYKLYVKFNAICDETHLKL